MTPERAKEILHLGAKQADYVRHMTHAETDYVNHNIWTIYISQHQVLRKIARGVKLPKEATKWGGR